MLRFRPDMSIAESMHRLRSTLSLTDHTEAGGQRAGGGQAGGGGQKDGIVNIEQLGSNDSGARGRARVR